MKVWNYSSKVLAGLLAAVSLVSAGGPADGDATADPNSAVVQLTAEGFDKFMDENPLVLAEFFAPWCGYCKMLGPEFSKAADELNESHPDIKLAQIDCTKEEKLCEEFKIEGYPTLRVFRGVSMDEYQGPRSAEGIARYMIRQSMPPVQVPGTWEELQEVLEFKRNPYVIQFSPNKGDEEKHDIFYDVASKFRQDYTFLRVEEPKVIKKLIKEFTNVELDPKKLNHILVYPNAFDDVREFVEDEFNADTFTNFIKIEALPYFGDINRETYMLYMSSSTPLAYYFYNSFEQRQAMAEGLSELGKKYKGNLSFVGLNAVQYGKHAEVINMDPSIVPFFAIHVADKNRKYGIDQAAYPDGPDLETIEKFVEDFFADKLKPLTKSEPLPTEEEIKANPVVKLVGHNHQEVLEDLTKDIFVKYYAPWCGHCKHLAPIWEDLAEIFNGNSDVIIANIDHTANDVDIPFEIEGYPTLVLYPANGEIDEATGIRKPIVFSGPRELDSFIKFIKEEGALKVDGDVLKSDKDEAGAEILEEEDVEHDEL